MLEFGILITILEHKTRFFITDPYAGILYSYYLLMFWINNFTNLPSNLYCFIVVCDITLCVEHFYKEGTEQFFAQIFSIF